MYNFDYHKAKSLAEAAKLLKEKSDPKLLAGGMTLVPTLKQRLASPSDLIDLNAIPDLRGISVNGKVLTVKAMTIHEDVEVSPDVKKAIPALAELAGLDRQCRPGGRLSGGHRRLERDGGNHRAQDRSRRFLQGPVRNRAQSR